MLSRDLDETAASLDAFATGEGDAWRRLYACYRRLEQPLPAGLVTPMPPVRPRASLALRLRRELPDFLRFAVLPARRLADEHFRGAGAPRLLAGSSLHSDLLTESPLSVRPRPAQNQDAARRRVAMR